MGYASKMRLLQIRLIEKYNLITSKNLKQIVLLPLLLHQPVFQFHRYRRLSHIIERVIQTHLCHFLLCRALRSLFNLIVVITVFFFHSHLALKVS